MRKKLSPIDQLADQRNTFDFIRNISRRCLKREDILKLFFLVFFVLPGLNKCYAQKTLTVDFNSTAGAIKKLTSVNNGPLSVVSGTAEMCYKQIGVEMIRTHDFHGPMDYYGYSNYYNLFDSSFNYSFLSYVDTNYRWTSSDLKMSQIADPGFIPFFRLGISASGQGNPAYTPPPKDSDNINFYNFAGICKRTAMHYTDSWDSGYAYTIPYWEVWNEPNNQGFWTGTVQDYYLMYKQVVDSIKSFNPDLKVGGPGTAKNAFYSGGNYFTLNQNYISSFFQYCQANSVPLDFYSFHTYDKKNPYHIKQLADTISYFLNQSGYDSTELVVSEMNVNTGGFLNSGKGCSHLASMLISASDTRISKMFWYRGVDLQPLCNSDSGTTASLQLQGYAYQFFNELYDSTSIKLSTSGNEFVLNNINDSLNNLMIISGKNASDDLVKVMVSNYESSYNGVNVEITNLPWLTTDLVDVSIQKVTDSGFVNSDTTLTGASTMTINLTNVIDASTYLITLRKSSVVSSLGPVSVKKIQIFPNPATDQIKFSQTLNDIEIYNIYGRLIQPKILSANSFSVQGYEDGVYLLRTDKGSAMFVVKH